MLVRATQAWESAGIDAAPLADLIEALSATNEMLWAEEDRIRECERDGAFGAPFVASARSIVRLNDRRSALKREISARCGSTSAGEVKIYPW